MVEKAKLIIEAYNRMGYDACAVAECPRTEGGPPETSSPARGS